MPTLTELISERRAAIEAFDHDVYGPEQHDIIALNHAIERTPIASKADALSALDLIMAETCSELEHLHHLVVSLIAALRRYVETTAEV